MSRNRGRIDRQPKPTLKTIAQLTGLAPATVSRALNDADDISSSTKERVRLAARQIGYRPDRAGFRLRTGKSRVIALVLNMEDEILGIAGPLVNGVAEVLSRSGYGMVVVPDSPHEDPLKAVGEVLDSGMADGLIITRTQPMDQRVIFLTNEEFPFVTFGRTQLRSVHASVDFDNETFAYESVRRLADNGRRNIALLAPPSHLMFCKHMSDGFRRGIRDFGCVEVPFGNVDLDSPLEDIFKEGTRWPFESGLVDGFVAGSASTGVALLAGLESVGARIKVDFDMVAKEPTRFTEWIRPEIIPINEDIRAAGNELARTIISVASGTELASLQLLIAPKFRDASV
jgi:LacI family transcriptional regulator